MILAQKIVMFEKASLDGDCEVIGIPYRFYLGIKHDFFDFIEQKRVFDSLGEDLGRLWSGPPVKMQIPIS